MQVVARAVPPLRRGFKDTPPEPMEILVLVPPPWLVDLSRLGVGSVVDWIGNDWMSSMKLNQKSLRKNIKSWSAAERKQSITKNPSNSVVAFVKVRNEGEFGKELFISRQMTWSRSYSHSPYCHLISFPEDHFTSFNTARANLALIPFYSILHSISQY